MDRMDFELLQACREQSIIRGAKVIELGQRIATLRKALEASCVCGGVDQKEKFPTWEYCLACKALAATSSQAES